MKKKFKLLLLLVALIPFMVYADMGAPITMPYELVVVASDGIDYYDWEGNVMGHLNKDDKFTVSYEYNDGYTIHIPNSNDAFQLKQLTGTILMSEEFKPEDYKKTDDVGTALVKATSNNTVLVYADDGVDIRKGPSTVYDKVGHLDKGKTIKYTYALDGGGITHIYVNSNGVTGWIDILEGKVLLEKTSKYVTSKDISLSCITVPKNTILTGKYITDNWTHKALVKYGECEDLYNYFKGMDGLVQIIESNYKAKESIDVYENYDDGGEKITTIPVDTVFKLLANVSLNGEEYIKLYVEHDGKQGWVKTNYDKIEATDEDVIANQKEEEKGKEDTTDVVDDVTTIGSEKTMTPLDKTLIYVIGGLVLAVTALVTIILINKKKRVHESIAEKGTSNPENSNEQE